MRTGRGWSVRIPRSSTSVSKTEKLSPVPLTDNDEARTMIAAAVKRYGASKVALTLGCARSTLVAYLARTCRQTTNDSIPLRAPLLAQLEIGR